MTDPAPPPQSKPPLSAVISKEWRNRMLMIAAFIFASGAWFMFDGLVGYPANNLRFSAWEEASAGFGDDTEAAEAAYKEIADEKGWKAKPPKKAYSEQDILVQIIIASVAFAGAAWVLVVFFRDLPRKLHSDGVHITGPDGKTRVPILAIKSVDKRKWKDQGIALLRYQHNGQLRRFILDDYKFIGAAQILTDAEERLKADRAARAVSGESETSTT